MSDSGTALADGRSAFAERRWWPGSDLRAPAMSRPFLEQVVRRRVAALPDVAVRERAMVVGLTVDGSGGRVAGVGGLGGESPPVAEGERIT